MKIILIGFILFLSNMADAARIKDLSSVRGVRENQLIGYGLIVGLNGTGDGKGEFTSKSFARMLDNLGMKLENKDIESKNVAAVIVTATLPPFAKAGNKIDVTVNSIGSASSLQGGTLLQTPLRGADQQVYAVAQGTVAVAQPSTAGAQGGGVGGGEKAITTAARVPNGAIIEKDLAGDFTNKRLIRFSLNNPDFTTAARMVKTINQDLGGKYASAKDSATIDIVAPASYEGNTVELLANIENLDVTSDAKAKVVINEKTGTVVIGEKVQIGTIALSHGGITIQVTQDVSQAPQNPVPVRGPASLQNQNKGAASVALFNKSTNVGDLVKALNNLGISPKDLISILQSIKAAGALHGELEVL
ncbi:MAG: flagellar basal body P-ring protein FlgI [Oligoflexia bacterium]|nr:flagellar basal body P-ring protein FlgI [Oligoflexia bacterium]